jgi:hypothetical protein
MANAKEYWLDRSENVTKLFRGLCIVCLATLSIALFLHKHELFEFATWYGFYGIFGFFACVVLVLVAKQLRRVLMRSEDYYER